MMNRSCLLVGVFLSVTSISGSAWAQSQGRVALGDWPEVRGPHRDGRSTETGLPDTWALEGENFLWRAPFGGRSTPIVLGNRVYVQNPSGRGPDLQERVMSLDADTGDVIWEYTFNVFQSDVPTHRLGWASPAADPETGNVYALGVGALLVALDSDGALLWERSIGEEFAAFTTHGGRTMSPLIDGDLVIVSSAISNWGSQANRRPRFIALDKRTGDIMYVASPTGRPYDTTYASPVIATINGTRLLICGLGDGGVHAIKPQTGEKVWSFAAAKRGINTGVVISDETVVISHGDENFDTNEMGMIAAIDGSQTGDISTVKWSTTGNQFRFSSPVTDDVRVYQIDNGSTLRAFDLKTGEALWAQRLGTAQRAPAVLADGKIYVGTDNGKFFIVRPHADRAEILSEVLLPVSADSVGGSEGTPEQILSAAAISRGRIFFVSSDAVYAIGPKQAANLTGWAVDEPLEQGVGEPAHVQVTPTELVLEPGQTVELTARLFDGRGRFLREERAIWSLEGLKGTMSNGTFTVASDPVEQAGVIRAAVNGLTGEARARIVRPLPWNETFESYADGGRPPGWVNAEAGLFSVATLDGQKVLQKEPIGNIFKRIRMFVGPVNWSNYTIAVDVRSNTRRRQLSNIGVTAQRYTLRLDGSAQRLKLEPWEPEVERTVAVPFSWKADTWYRLKLRVENLPNGEVRARGKVWPTSEPEPAEWMIDNVDPIGNRQGAPGFFVHAEFGAYLDNLQIVPND